MFHVEQAERFAKTLAEEAGRLGVTLTTNHLSQFTVYFEELVTWNRKINLTAIRKTEEIAIKHFVDSLAVMKGLPAEPRITLLDIGTGAGFPGVPLKIFDPTIELTLVEPSRKKTAFLHHLIGSLGLAQVTIRSCRVEQFLADPPWMGRFSAIVTRALRLEPLLTQVGALLRADGRLILCRAASLGKAPGGFSIEREVAYELPQGSGHRVLSVLKPIAGGQA